MLTSSNLAKIILGLSGVLGLLSSCSPKPGFKAPLSLPAAEGAEGMRLNTDPQGKLYASWLNPTPGGGWQFQFSQWEQNSWSAPKTIAEGGREWYASWADAPRLARGSDANKTFYASWLVGSSRRNPYDHNIFISSSPDGESWNEPYSPYPDKSIPAYFGLNRFLALPNGQMLLLWMDGRDTKFRVPGTDRFYPKEGASIYLMSALTQGNEPFSEGIVVDSLISELCPFDLTLTAKGPLLVYRDRLPDKSRPICLKRWKASGWQKVDFPHSDHWKLTYYLTEGPILDASDKLVALAWYSASDKDPRIEVCFSENAGDSFSPPFRLPGGTPLGKADIAINKKGNALVSWITDAPEGAQLQLAEVSPAGKVIRSSTVANLGPDKVLQYPSLENFKEGTALLWKETGGDYQVLYFD